MEQTLEEWEDGWRIRLPLPFQLKWIYAYLIREKQGFTVIDCGLNDKAVWEAWQAVFKYLHIQPQEIKRIILTHYHPDHYGLTGRLQQLTGAEVRMSPETKAYARLFWGAGTRQLEHIVSFYTRHGLPEAITATMIAHLHKFRRWVSPHPENPDLLKSGHTILLGGRTYHIWDTPGHAEGHLAYYDADREWLIGGDVLLSKITPNISLYPNGDENPLRTFLTTLRRLKEKPIRKVFPAHGPVFTNVQERIDAVLDHHEERLAHTERFADGTQAAYDICLHMFGQNLSIHHLRFAMAETLAHLEHLRQQGRLSLVKKGKRYFYRRT